MSRTTFSDTCGARSGNWSRACCGTCGGHIKATRPDDGRWDVADGLEQDGVAPGYLVTNGWIDHAWCTAGRARLLHLRQPPQPPRREREQGHEQRVAPVSYTHLTLPTN